MPKSLPYRKRLEIIYLHHNSEGPKLSIAKTAKRLHISRHTVSRWVAKFIKTGDVLDELRPGRPRKTSHKEDEIIENAFFQLKELTPKRMASEIKNMGLNISSETIKRRLKEKGFRYRSPAFKPFLTKKQMDIRLNFAKENKTRDWSKVVFTDESTIRLTPTVQRIWKKRGHPVFVKRYKNYSKINIWGCFSNSGFGRIILFKSNLTAKKLIRIYKNGLLRSFPSIATGRLVLLEDNDPKHTAKIAKTYRKSHNIKRINWPANSPDLNPIENVWYILKYRIKKYGASNINQLKTAIKTEWSKLGQNLARSLVLSMPTRMKQVILSKGDSIKY